MQNLGEIQAEVRRRIKKASAEDDGHALGLLGPIAAEMDRKGREWESLLNLPVSGTVPPQNNGAPIPESAEDFEGKDIHFVTILGSRSPVGSYKEALIAVASRLQAAHSDFDSIAISVRGRRRPYFSANKDDLRKSERLRNSRLFVETNFPANQIYDVCRRLVSAFGNDPSDPSVLKFWAEPARTRRVARRNQREVKSVYNERGFRTFGVTQ
jgi:hypothetical protein